MEFEIGRLAGLPAHALLVHVPVILTPVTALGSVLTAFSRRWRQRYGHLVLGLAMVLAVATQLAIGSGQALKEAVRKTPLVKKHVGQSDLLEPVMLALLAAVAALLLIDRFRQPQPPLRLRARLTSNRIRFLSCAFAVMTVVSAGAATALVVRAGHSGAKAVWKNNPQIIHPLR